MVPGTSMAKVARRQQKTIALQLSHKRKDCLQLSPLDENRIAFLSYIKMD